MKKIQYQRNLQATVQSQKRLRVKIKEGDIVAFKIASGQYRFARILLDSFAQRQSGDIIRPELHWVHPRSLIVAPYAHYADTLQLDIDKLVNKKTLPTLCIFDLYVYRGEMPIVGHKPLSYLQKTSAALPTPEVMLYMLE